LTGYGAYAVSGLPVPIFVGTYLGAHSTFAASWNRVYAGNIYPQTPQYHNYIVPASIGFTYTSKGQLLRPDFGNDAGTQNGPAFGKKRRLHWWAAALYRARSISVGTDFAKLKPVKLASPGGIAVAAPGLYSGIVTDTIDNDYSFEGQIAWQITRPYPAMVLTVGGYLEGVDK
jgi:hypothetical protein